jgi:pyruvate formate lyase activating enzyme
MANEIKGLIFDVQGYSVHDGPGCRTLVFMKGCPLRCEWCSNPEGMRGTQEILFRNTKCVNRANGCTRCIDSCPQHAIVHNIDREEHASQLLINRNLCNVCITHECLTACYFEGLRSCGEWWTDTDLMSLLERNRHYWGTNGGVSFSGGEPLLQNEFMQVMLEACKSAQIHVTIETTANIPTDHFLGLMSMVDFAFIDLKHMDPGQHRTRTGVDNGLILRNIENLVNTNWPGRLILRLMVVEDFNDTDGNIEASATFMQRFGLFEVNILPFHRLGDTKWTQLGKEYLYRDKASISESKLIHIQEMFLSKNIACYIGADTPF